MFRIFLRRVYNRLNTYNSTLIKSTCWAVLLAIRYARQCRHTEQRILAIWDLKAVPYSIGDFLVLHEATLCLRILHQVEKVDICLVCDPNSPSRGDHFSVTSGNYHHHLATIISLIYVNPHLGSFFLFDSYEEVE